MRVVRAKLVELQDIVEQRRPLPAPPAVGALEVRHDVLLRGLELSGQPIGGQATRSEQPSFTDPQQDVGAGEDDDQRERDARDTVDDEVRSGGDDREATDDVYNASPLEPQ